MADILELAERLNSEVTRLNNERNKQLGMLESAKTQYDRAVKAYETKYGVVLTAENLQSEYNNVYARAKGAIVDLQESIQHINSGDYERTEEEPFDLAPDVEAIREEKAQKKGKTTRAKGATKPTETPVVIEDLSDTPAPASVPTAKAPVSVNTAEAFPELEVDVVKPAQVAPQAPKSPRGPVKGSILTQAVSDAEKVVQTPVVAPVIDVDGEGFGDFGDFGGSLGVEPVTAPVAAPAPKAQPILSSDDEVSLGDLNGFGDFGDFGAPAKATTNAPANAPTTTFPKNTVSKKEVPVEISEAVFGGFGTLESEAAPVETDVEAAPKKETAYAPEGWGKSDFGDFSNFDDLLTSGSVTFGE